MKLSQSYFNPRAPYGARRAAGNHRELAGDISIHAPHTGRDKRGLLSQVEATEFQSTRPIRGATSAHSWQRYSAHLFQSTRPIRGATYCAEEYHHTESQFQSTRPIRGATNQFLHAGLEIAISIHAPHTGRDAEVGARHISRRYFNPRAPYGARPTRWCGTWTANGFQSTRPIRGATHTNADIAEKLIRFQSTRPIRGATGRFVLGFFSTEFQSTRPIRGATICHFILPSGRKEFQSTRPIRGATGAAYILRLLALYFNPRAPYGARLSSALRRFCNM